MSRRVTEILAGGDRAVTAADALSRDSAVFGQVLAGLKNGNDEIGVQRVTSTAALDAVNAVDKLYAASIKEMEASCRRPPTCSRCSRPRRRSPAIPTCCSRTRRRCRAPSAPA
jgi:hypothetical protein